MEKEKCKLNKENCWYFDEEASSSSFSRTNRDWLFSLSDKELAEFLCGGEFQRLKLMWNSSVLGVEQWLSEEHREGKKAYERI